MLKFIEEDVIKEVRFEVKKRGYYIDDEKPDWIHQNCTATHDIYLRYDDDGNLLEVDPNMVLNEEEKEMFCKEILRLVEEYSKFKEYRTFENEDED